MAKAKEAALAAIGVYNHPSNRFKSETFIVLMVIAWTYLFTRTFGRNQSSTGTSHKAPSDVTLNGRSTVHTSTGNWNVA